MTAFVTHNGHFEFNRMPFRLRNAPCTLQRIMTQLVAPLSKFVVSYVDEVIIATHTVEENLYYLEECLKIIRDEGLTFRISKCTFMRSHATFLGHEVGADGIMPGGRKTEAIKGYPKSSTQLEVIRFLGLTRFSLNFYLATH